MRHQKLRKPSPKKNLLLMRRPKSISLLSRMIRKKLRSKPRLSHMHMKTGVSTEEVVEVTAVVSVATGEVTEAVIMAIRKAATITTALVVTEVGAITEVVQELPPTKMKTDSSLKQASRSNNTVEIVGVDIVVKEVAIGVVTEAATGKAAAVGNAEAVEKAAVVTEAAKPTKVQVTKTRL